VYETTFNTGVVKPLQCIYEELGGINVFENWF